jgi:hypothetical protein
MRAEVFGYSGSVAKASNIRRRGQALRLILGLLTSCLGLALGLTVILAGEPRLLYAPAFLLLWVGGLGVLQSREKT